MHRKHSGILLLTVSLAVVLLAGAVAGVACIGPIGCGLACTACSACAQSCEEMFNDFIPDQPVVDAGELWDGPGSIQETPTPEPIVDVTAIPPAPEPTPAPQTDAQTARPQGILDQQEPIVLSGVREPRVQLRRDGTDTATVLVLMNGSDLESEYGEATADLTEMVRAAKSDRVNVLVQTVGTKKWANTYGVSARRSQRWKVEQSGLTLLDDSLGQLDTTVPSTLSDFICWGAETCPADRYILVLWDHGGGPVYGFGYDEYQPYTSTLTIDEMQIALKDGGVYFDLIGMDSCLMSSLEVCCALYEYCDYTLLSEDFEPGSGWSYTGWLNALANEPAIGTQALAKIAIDDTVRYCEAHNDEDDGVTLALMDQAYMKILYTAWVEFAYANEEALLNANYSQLRQSNGRVHPRLRKSVSDWFSQDSTLEDYFVTDILAVAQNIDSDESAALVAALKKAVVCFGATFGETAMTGISVTLPYGDKSFYDELKRVFRNAGFDMDYVNWLERFTAVETAPDEHFDFGGWSDLWGGWSDTESDFDWNTWFYDDETSDDTWADDDLLSWLFGD